MSDTNCSRYLSIQPLNNNHEMVPKHSSNDDVLETGLSNNTVPKSASPWRRPDICMLAGGSVSRPLLCALHIKSFMEAIKCVVNGQELAEWLYNWISSYDGPHYKMK